MYATPTSRIGSLFHQATRHQEPIITPVIVPAMADAMPATPNDDPAMAKTYAHENAARIRRYFQARVLSCLLRSCYTSRACSTRAAAARVNLKTRSPLPL